MLEIKNLTVELSSPENPFYILRRVSINLKKGCILGLAGESGSGKSVLAKTVMGLNSPPVKTLSGEIILNGKPLETESDFKAARGKKISMIFQNPQASLNPVMTIGAQLTETIRLGRKISGAKAAEKAAELLSSVEIDRPAERLKAYPHQLSGGMNQRVMIALALASDPEILIADEPTTALDVTIQAQIIKLIMKLNRERRLTTLFISHDLSLLMRICPEIAVLYCGELMEITSGSDLREDRLLHPYTKALKSCIPEIGVKTALTTIKGSIGRNDASADSRCIFAERCPRAEKICFESKPAFNGRYACHRPLIKTGEEKI